MNPKIKMQNSDPHRLYHRRYWIVLCVALSPFVIIGILIALRIFGLLRPFSTPANSMSPAVSAGDCVMMENFTFLLHKPVRGDIVIFKTDGIEKLKPGSFFTKRVAGEPGDLLRITDGKVFVNEKQVSLNNSKGEIMYKFPPKGDPYFLLTSLKVPDSRYYVLGDNSTNSFDSRFFGTLPAENIIGRVWFCYWPPQRIGLVK